MLLGNWCWRQEPFRRIGKISAERHGVRVFLKEDGIELIER